MSASKATYAAVLFKVRDLLIVETIPISNHIKINAKNRLPDLRLDTV